MLKKTCKKNKLKKRQTFLSPKSADTDALHGGPERQQEGGGDGELLEESGGRHARPPGQQQLVAQSTEPVQEGGRERPGERGFVGRKTSTLTYSVLPGPFKRVGPLHYSF